MSDDGNGTARTRRIDDMGARGTLRITDEQARERGMPLGALPPGVLLCNAYTVERTLHPHETQRPGLFLCRGPEGRVVVKVAATRFPPKAELWQRLPFLHHPHILRTYQVLEVDDLYYEIQELCPGGSLAERIAPAGAVTSLAMVDWIISTVIPQLQQALCYLHAQDIIHRDVKPANIYLKRDDSGQELLVLGDFDISAVLEQTHTSRDTERLAGTWLYTAPEAFPRFLDDHAGSRLGRVTRSSDYYSLGVTLIELLIGTTSLHLCQLPDIFDFYLQGGRVEIPQGLPGRLSLLLRGLLIRNRRARWGADEVARWLDNRTSDVDMQAIADDEFYELARGSRPYRLQQRFAVDLPSLAEAMFHEQETATEDLITADVLLNWIGSIDSNLARQLRRDRDTHYLSPALVLFNAIYRCDPTRPFIFEDGVEVQTVDAWVAQALALLSRSRRKPEEWLTGRLLHHLESWLRLKESPLIDLADRVHALHETPATVRFEELIYLLQPERPFPIMQGLSAPTPRAFVTLAYGNAESWQEQGVPVHYQAAYHRWRDGALAGWLRQRGMEAQARESEALRAAMAENEPQAAFEATLRLLDPELPPVTVTVLPADVAPVRVVPYGKTRTFALLYRAQGPGVPFGALRVDTPRASVQLGNYRVNGRSGRLEVTIDASLDSRALVIVTVPIVMESALARLQPSPLLLRYRIDFSTQMVVQRILAGICIGAGTFGLPRFLLYIFGEQAPLTRSGHGLTRIWPDTLNGEFPLLLVIVAFFLLAAALFGALRLWFAVYRRSDV